MMNKVLTAMILAGLAITATTASAAEPFRCSGESYSLYGENAQLLKIDASTGKSQSMWGANTYSAPINAAGYNSDDNFIYGLASGGKLVRISKGASSQESVELLNVPVLKRIAGDYNTGDVYNGYLYVTISGQNTKQPLAYRINLTDLGPDSVWEAFNLAADENNLIPPDMAFDPNAATPTAYGSLNGKVIKLNMTEGGRVEQIFTMDHGAYGSAFFDDDGKLYVIDNNTGTIHKVDIKEQTTEVFSTEAAVDPISDGAHCAYAPVGAYDLTYSNRVFSHKINTKAWIENNSGNKVVVSGEIKQNFSRSFSETDAVMMAADVRPGDLRELGFFVEDQTVSCGVNEIINKLDYALYESDGVYSCQKSELLDAILIHNKSNDTVYPSVDNKYGWSADSQYGWLKPEQSKLYQDGDVWLSAPAVGFNVGDTIPELGFYHPSEGYISCGTNVQWTGFIEYEIQTDLSCKLID